ncbi:DapH/DapD/GlmU-related protein [Lacticaseibacillus suibinensis]|uniref:DapH/DapD/GlmU-related protein n=1 Tax=Lacticaseibacillus suibinensis TaxID=2486011 RepID=UPI000F771823|nr:DapH/DapD/GlmU-related protein [Lacticaseibacillus suibinensis]
MNFDHLINAGHVSWGGATAAAVHAVVAETSALLIALNQATTDEARRQQLTAILGYSLPTSSVLNPPFQTDFGRHTTIGANVFINRDCFFVDLGGIILDDGVLLGPRVTLISVNHSEDPTQRRDLVLKAVHIKTGAWLGANVTVLPGVTIGEHAIVGAGAVVTKDVPANTIVAGVPAQVIRPVKSTHKENSHD